MTRMAVAALAAMLGLAGAHEARAYYYNVVSDNGSDITWVWLHTVSGFCKNESWTGYLQAGSLLELSTASICLVNRVEMAGRNWRNWILNYDLPVGVPSGNFYLSTWQQEGDRPLCFTYGGVHRRAFCGGSMRCPGQPSERCPMKERSP